MTRRVAITGIGMITPLGIGTEDSWAAICEGKSGVSNITRFDASRLKTQIAGEIRGFDPLEYMPAKEANRNDTFIHYAIASTKMALDDAELVID